VPDHFDRVAQEQVRFSDVSRRAVALVRTQVIRVRHVARQAVDPGPVAHGVDDTLGRLRHLEVALEEAYARIEMLEVLAAEAVAVMDHQATRLAILEDDLRRARTSPA
jgi:hypothetical protein